MANRIMNLNILKNNSGFGLIEVIVALLVLSIALIPIIQMSSSHYKDTVDAGIKATALNLAQGLLEEYKSTKEDEGEVDEDTNFNAPFGRYTYTVKKIDETETTETYEMTIKYDGKDIAKLVGEVEK